MPAPHAAPLVAPPAAPPSAPDTSGGAAHRPPPVSVRSFGRFALKQLLGKSERSMVWLAHDPRSSQDVMLTLPRVQPADAAALESWHRRVGQAARLNHPQMAAPIEVGVQDHWPYVAVDRAYGSTLGEWLSTHRDGPVTELVGWVCQALEGLAFAHDAGLAHGDLQLHSLLVSEHGVLRVMGFGTCSEAVASTASPSPSSAAAARPTTVVHDRALAVGADELRAQREGAERDVLAVGLILYRLLAGQSPLDEADVGSVAGRLAPLGRDIVRLPWSLPKPVPEALRAIVNRSTAAQPRQRYLNARTLLRALRGWIEVEGAGSGGHLVVLLDRLRTVGHLPAMPGVGRRVARLAAAEGQRTDELAAEILQDMALSFELLRQVNSSLLQSAQASGGAAVMTVRRAVAMLGLDGIRRAAGSLRPWPGPLNEGSAHSLQRAIDRVRLAGQLAVQLRPPGYDTEVVLLVAMLQNLGRLLAHYHFPEEAGQMLQLMRSAPPPAGSEPGTPDSPGLSEASASMAVLGVDIDALGAAVAKYWGLGDEVQSMMRRIDKERTPRSPANDTELLRTLCSAANEVIDAVHLLEAHRLPSAIQQIAQRYGRALNVDAKGIKDAFQAARQGARRSAEPAASAGPEPGNATGQEVAVIAQETTMAVNKPTAG